MVPVRSADVHDLDLLAKMNAYVHDLHVQRAPERYRVPVFEEVRAAFAHFFSNEDASIGLFEEDDLPLGYIVLIVTVRPQTPFTHLRRRMMVDQVAVAENARGQGVGRALMTWAEEQAREVGCAQLSLDVASFNTGAHDFYVHLGYEPVQTRLSKKL